MIKYEQWDSENFGFKVGSLIPDHNNKITAEYLDAIINTGKKEGYRLLYLKGVVLDKELTDSKVKLVDEKVIYSQIVQGEHLGDSNVVSIKNCDLSETLLNLSYESGKYSRYRTDPDMPEFVFTVLYKIWLQNSLNGKIASDVLSYVINGVPQSILTYKEKEGLVTIGLIAVNSSVSGSGIGTKMMQTFLSSLPLNTVVEVATQKTNKIACRFYEKNGFTPKSVTNIFHIWIK